MKDREPDCCLSLESSVYGKSVYDSAICEFNSIITKWQVLFCGFPVSNNWFDKKGIPQTQSQ